MIAILVDPDDVLNLPLITWKAHFFYRAGLCRSNQIPSVLWIQISFETENGPRQPTFRICQGDYISPSLLASYCLIRWVMEIRGQDHFPYFQASMRKPSMRLLSPPGINAFHASFHLVFTPGVCDWWSLGNFRRSYKWWIAGKRFTSNVLNWKATLFNAMLRCLARVGQDGAGAENSPVT